MKPHVYRSASAWSVEFTDASNRRLFRHFDSWEHALRVANRIARRQRREP